MNTSIISNESPQDGGRRAPAETFAPSYLLVWEKAQAYGAREPDRLVRLRHLLLAFIEVDVHALKTVLARRTLTLSSFELVPVPQETEEDQPSGTCIRVSNLVNKVLSLNGGNMEKVVRSFRVPTAITSVHLAAALVLEPAGPVGELLTLNGISPTAPTYGKNVLARLHAAVADIQKREEAGRRMRQIAGLRRVRLRLKETCFGQDEAIDTLIAQISTNWSQPTPDRGFRPLSFALIGESGTGKSLLATALRDALADEFGTGAPPALDMSRYAAEQAAIDLYGRDSSWKDGGRPGRLTELGANFPDGVLIIENFDKAHPEAIAHINTLLTDGQIVDEFTHRPVSFAQNIVLLTTNSGSAYLRTRAFARFRDENGGTIPREKLLEGISASFSQGEAVKRGILDGILSKVDHPIAFQGHTLASTAQIATQSIRQTLAQMKDVFQAEVHADEDALRAFFLDTRPNFASAYGIAQQISSTLLTSVEGTLLRADSPAPSTVRRISVLVDPLPDLDPDGTVAKADTAPDFTRHTAARLKQAKRLAFRTQVECGADGITIHLCDLRYVLMPAIEEADWFSVRPSDTRIANLVGMERAWEQAARILAYRKNRPHKFLKPDNILLYGPPGTGKTAFAKALAAELNCGFIAINGSDLTATAQGPGAIQKVQDLFAAAERNEAVIFIDEIDAVGSRGTATSTQAKVINALLTELDGFEGHAPLLVIGATNHPDMIDPALTRPGRLHARIKIDILHKAADRARLVDIFCAQTHLAIPPDVRRFIVQSTGGWTPASILSVLRETVYLSGDRAPSLATFIQARTVEFAGQESQSRTLSAAAKRNVALHEAGHALAASLYGHPWVQVSVNGTNGFLGFLESLQDEDGLTLSEQDLLERIDISLAGRVAEELLACATDGCTQDFAMATGFAQRIIHGGFRGHDELAVTPDAYNGTLEWERLRPQVNAILRDRFDHVSQLLAAHKAVLRQIADNLVARGTLFPDDIQSLLVRVRKPAPFLHAQPPEFAA